MAFTLNSRIAKKAGSGGTSTGGGVVQIPFSATVPFTGNIASMAARVADSSIAFTVGASPVAGSEVTVRLTSDGVVIPTFTGFKELGGSGWDARPGIVNVVAFMHDGVDAWYSITQQVGAAPVAATGQVVRVATNLNLVESGSAGAGWTYTGTAGNWTQYGLCDMKLASGEAGAFWGDMGPAPNSSTTAGMVGLKTTKVNGAYTGYAFGIFADTSTTSTYRVVRNGTAGGPDTARNYAAGDKIRIRVAPGGTTVYAEVSSDGGASWAIVKTWTGVTPSDLYCMVTTSSTASPASNGSVGNLRGSNLVAA